MKRFLTLGFAALAIAGCDSGTSSDPATATRDALNPPRGLVTVTGNNKIELRWLTGNAEDEFKGYHVFAIAKTVAEVGTPAYPVGATTDSGFPRCKDNSAIFETFGFAKKETDCEGGDEAAKTTAGGTATGFGMAEGDEAKVEKIENAVNCEGDTDDTISLAVNGMSLDEKVCVVTKAYDPASKTFVNLANGTTYTFFVAAVSGDDKSVISWTSNFVEDTPAKPLFSNSIKITKNQYRYIDGTKLQSLTELVEGDFKSGVCNGTTATDICIVTGGQSGAVLDNQSGNQLGIYFGRLGEGNFPQRVFISVPKDKGIELQLRGPQTFDPMKPTAGPQTSIPGDRAANTTYIRGTKFPVYGNQVFDIKSTKDAKVNYGKIVVGQPTLAAGADPTSELTIPVTVIMQPKVGSFDYFR